MNFEHTEDRRMLADSLNRFVSEQYAIEARNHVAYGEEGHSPLLYGQFADIGAIGALFPEDAGGFGGQGFDISVVFECLGRGLVAEPLLGALVVGQALIAAGSDAQKEQLAAIIGGTSIAALAHDEPGSHYELNNVATTAVRRTLPTPFLLRAGLHCVSAAEKTAESAKATAFTARVRLRTGRTEGKNTGQQRRAPPKHHRAIRKRKLRSHVFVAGNRCAMHHCATIDNRQPHCTPVPSAGVDRPQTVARNCQGSVAARPTDCSRDSVNNVTVCFNWAFTASCCRLGPCFCRYH